MTCRKKSILYEISKRAFDFAFSLFAILFFLPVFLAAAILIKIDSPGPVIFSHIRIGQGGKKIKVYKFRTMFQNSDEIFAAFSPEQKAEFALKFKLERDPRVTKIGSIMRKASIDELPQLFNILKGDMSVVGHRPIVDAEIERYGKYFGMIFAIKPGLTGYWQANGRSETSYEKRVAMDLYYLQNRSVLLDLDIIFKTIAGVIRRKGAF